MDPTKALQNELLAKSLAQAKRIAKGNVIKSTDLDHSARKKLSTAGYLYAIMRGWYLLTTPVGKGTSTLWFSNYWDFVREYLNDRFGDEYCLTAESSLDLLSEQNIISRQITIMTKRPSNQTINLPHDTSLLLYQDDKNFPKTMEKKNGLNSIPLNIAICKAQPAYFVNNSLNVEICLKMISSPSDLSRVLLSEQLVSAANRIIGAYQALKDDHSANQIQGDLLAAGIALHPINPFENNKLFLTGKPQLRSPYSGRISAMWDKMRGDVLTVFPKNRALPGKSTIKIIEKLYRQDSYHSLSIEGYQVTPELIDKIAKAKWTPETENLDGQHWDALAAKGYHGAFYSVLQSVSKVLAGNSAGKIFYEDVQTWYRELFKPLVQAGLVPSQSLAGYRNQQVYISGSRHVPPPTIAVLDSMSCLEVKLRTEESAAVRAILGHFIFVFIHPYMDGNGRIGRFIMNLMLISGGFNWTVIRTSERNRYMSALEAASVDCNIKPFAKFVLSEMKYWEKNKNNFINSK